MMGQLRPVAVVPAAASQVPASPSKPPAAAAGGGGVVDGRGLIPRLLEACFDAMSGPAGVGIEFTVKGTDT